MTVGGPTDAKPGKEEPPRIFVPTVRMPTALEARHAAAVVALHHFNSHLSMIMLLPHEYRDIWRALDEELRSKKQAEKAVVEALPPPVETKLEKKERPLPLVVLTDEARRLIDGAVKQPAGAAGEMAEESAGVPEGAEFDALADALVAQGFERDSAQFRKLYCGLLRAIYRHRVALSQRARGAPPCALRSRNSYCNSHAGALGCI